MASPTTAALDAFMNGARSRREKNVVRHCEVPPHHRHACKSGAFKWRIEKYVCAESLSLFLFASCTCARAHRAHQLHCRSLPRGVLPSSLNVRPSMQCDALLFFLSSSSWFRLILCPALAQTLGKGTEGARGPNGTPHNAHERKDDSEKGSGRKREMRRRRAEGTAGPPSDAK